MKIFNMKKFIFDNEHIFFYRNSDIDHAFSNQIRLETIDAEIPCFIYNENA